MLYTYVHFRRFSLVRGDVVFGVGETARNDAREDPLVGKTPYYVPMLSTDMGNLQPGSPRKRVNPSVWQT
jgi:hypothetical protein